MKAGVAANLAVARTLHAAGVRLERPLAVHCVIGEEDGGLGGFATLRRGHIGEAAVITEPTSAQIITATAGALTFRIEVAGRLGARRCAPRASAPSRRSCRSTPRCSSSRPSATGTPTRGSSPSRALRAVDRHGSRPGSGPATCPTGWSPRDASGVQLDEDPRLARARFEDVVTEVAAKDPWLRENRPVVTWPGGQFASGSTDADHPLIGEMAEAAVPDRRHPAAAGAARLRQRPAALHRHRRHPHAALRSRRHAGRALAAGEDRPRPAGAGHPRADRARAAQVRDRRVSDDDLWFAGVTGQAAAVASGQVSSRRARGRGPRAHLAVRRPAERLHDGAGRGGARRGGRPGRARRGSAVRCTAYRSRSRRSSTSPAG